MDEHIKIPAGRRQACSWSDAYDLSVGPEIEYARVGFNQAAKQYCEDETKQLWQQASKLISEGLASTGRAPKRKPTLTFFSSKCFQIVPFAYGLRITHSFGKLAQSLLA
jgi:hypothetical protein